MKTAVLLVNVGTPDKPNVKYVRRFLFQFLNDLRVIDLPWLLQKILVNLIIVPFRAPKSTKIYKQVWGPNGSPLLHYSRRVQQKLQEKLPNNFYVFMAMRYGNPSLKRTLETVKEGHYDRFVVIPMFPQYASSTTGTVNEYILNKVKKWYITPDLLMINKFYDNKKFIDAFVNRAREYNYKDYEHIVFSYHGLPLRQINKSHPTIDCNTCTCHQAMPEHGHWCYKAQCYNTTRLLAKALNLSESEYTTAFQSRLSKNWLEPFSDKVVIEKAKEGTTSILFLAPAFVADCLETEVEIGIEYAELFEENGGEKLVMAPSLNDMDEWINAIQSMIIQS
jgi:ferrochelatase